MFVRSAVLVVAAVVLLGCSRSGSISHRIPEGYTGPVVIVFDDPKGVVPKHDDAGAVVYEIPRDGVLRLSTPPPAPGIYKVQYFYVSADGKQAKLPWDADKDRLQVFAAGSGSIEAKANEQPVRWDAYIVGIPSQRSDWVALRREATNRALGVSGGL